MTAKISDYKSILYSRDYSNDVPAQTQIVKRITLAAIPFLSLYAPLKAPLSFVMGSLRVWNMDHKDIFGTVMAVSAAAAAIFHHQKAMTLTIIHDTFIEINKIRNGQTLNENSKCLIKIVGNLLYLSLITEGGLKLSLLAVGYAGIVNLIDSINEFKNDRWIEGVANLLMATVRLSQSRTQYLEIKRNEEIALTMQNIHVGQLHEQWKFPSDHLPVGIEVNGIKIISWNVLNNAYIEWVTEKDSQGLNGSMISDLDISINEQGLTKRDVCVAEMVANMMKLGHIVTLQECGEPFLQHLQERLPSNWDLIKSFNVQKQDQDVILYNKTKMSYQSDLSETSTCSYPSVPNRPLQNAYFSNSKGLNLRIINVHIPGDPSLACKEELAKYVLQQQTLDSVTIALGDNNFEREEMVAAYRQAGFTDFSLHSPWKTNIDPYTKKSKGIDHLFVVGEHKSRDLRPDEVLIEGNLQETINLLNVPSTHPAHPVKKSKNL